MADRADARIRLHQDVPLFREAIAYTAAKTGFPAQVIEKDYFCTILLDDFARHGGAGLIFKGGTCMAKVHAGFYRLSEDLDFAIPMPVNASRTKRRLAADPIKSAVAGVAWKARHLWAWCGESWPFRAIHRLMWGKSGLLPCGDRWMRSSSRFCERTSFANSSSNARSRWSRTWRHESRRSMAAPD